MKQLFLSCTLLFVCYFSQAQFTKGSVLLGGDFGVSTGSDKTTISGTSTKTTNTDFNVHPSIGWAVHDNLVLGVDLGVGYVTQTGLKENEYDFGVFMRKYKPLVGRLYFFGETGLNFTYDDYISDNANSSPSHMEEKSSFIIMGFAPGIGYSLTHRWQVEIEFPNVIYAQYGHTETNSTVITQFYPTVLTDQQRDVSNGFTFNTSLTTSFELEVGLRYLIGK